MTRPYDPPLQIRLIIPDSFRSVDDVAVGAAEIVGYDVGDLEVIQMAHMTSTVQKTRNAVHLNALQPRSTIPGALLLLLY